MTSGAVVGMQILRTDEARFAGLPDYPFSPQWAEVQDGLHMHYVDEGPRKANPVVMIHGEPTWSYLWRHMIPVIANNGYRVLAPDLIGFGKSDKPDNPLDYTYDRHMQWLTQWMLTLDLRQVTLVCQNWGSLLGLQLAARHPDRIDRIIVGNGRLPSGNSHAPTGATLWRAFSLYSPWFPISQLVQLGTERSLSRGELAAYDAPFPSHAHKSGARGFPRLLPRLPTDHVSELYRDAWSALERWRKPFVTCFSNGDPVTRGADRDLQRRIPGAHGQPHITLRGGHFLQEDAPLDFARVILDACRSVMAA